MAGAEVSVSSEELLTVRDEEGEYSGSDQKSQVILHLQPILHGVNDDIAETGTTVLAIETHRDDSERDGDEIEYGYPITCGDSRAVLLFKKFVCPGINVRCVKFNDQLISPKQFVHLAGKATLKDWKRAIRLGGVMLRKMMDSGQIDFYQHDTLCSNTCHSTKFDVLINRTRLPPGNSVQPSLSCLALDPVGGQVSPVTEDVHKAAEVEESLQDKISAAAEWSNGPRRLVNPITANGHATNRKMADIPDGVLSLWKGVADCGMMGEVLSNLQTELFSTCKRVELHSENGNLQETDVMLLNSLCEMFGLLDSVKQAMDLRHSQTEKKKTQNSIYEFDELSEDERKQSCDKRISRKASSLKHLRTQRKSQTSSHFQNLLSSVKTATRHHAGSSRTDRDVKSGTLEGEQEISEADNQEKFHRPGQEGNKRKDTSGIHKEPGQRSVKFWGDSRVRSEGNEATEGLRDIEKMIMGRKASKKHKSK